MPNPLTPDAVRALITEADAYAGLDQYSGALLIRDLAAALGAYLPREDPDLDAQLREAGHWPDWFQGRDYCAGCGDGHMTRVLWADCSIRELAEALLARVRTAEAERDEARAHWEALSRLKVAELVREATAAISRTVETAAEWEYRSLGRCSESDDRRCYYTSSTVDDVREHEDEWHFGNHRDLSRHRPAGPWESVPPTPEEPTPVAPCGRDVPGTVPSWAGEDQIDPLPCALSMGHEGRHDHRTPTTEETP